MKYAESIMMYAARTGFHFVLASNPAIKTAMGSAIMPNIQNASGLAILAIELPSNAARKPILGPKIIPSIASR